MINDGGDGTMSYYCSLTTTKANEVLLQTGHLWTRWCYPQTSTTTTSTINVCSTTNQVLLPLSLLDSTHQRWPPQKQKISLSMCRHSKGTLGLSWTVSRIPIYIGGSTHCWVEPITCWKTRIYNLWYSLFPLDSIPQCIKDTVQNTRTVT